MHQPEHLEEILPERSRAYIRATVLLAGDEALRFLTSTPLPVDRTRLRIARLRLRQSSPARTLTCRADRARRDRAGKGESDRPVLGPCCCFAGPSGKIARDRRLQGATPMCCSPALPRATPRIFAGPQANPRQRTRM